MAKRAIAELRKEVHDLLKLHQGTENDRWFKKAQLNVAIQTLAWCLNRDGVEKPSEKIHREDEDARIR